MKHWKYSEKLEALGLVAFMLSMLLMGAAIVFAVYQKHWNTTVCVLGSMTELTAAGIIDLLLVPSAIIDEKGAEE